MEARLNIEVVEKDGLKRELNIEVPAEIVDETYKKIYDVMRQKAKIKGFRPGKVPANIIRSKYKQEATAEVIDQLVNKYYEEAIKEKKLEPVGTPTLTKADVDEGKPFTFTIGIEVMPEIENVTYDGISIDKTDVEVPDEDVNRVLEQLRMGHAEMRAVERKAQEGDVLICDIEAIGGDIDMFEEKASKNQEIDLSHEYTDKEFREGLRGLGRDETKEITVTYPADYQNPNFANKTITYNVTVREIKERILPPLTDDFAKIVGQGETLLELKLHIRKNLEEERQAQMTRTNKKVIVDFVTGANQIDVPDAMMETYFKNLMAEQKQQDPDGEIDEKEIREKFSGTARDAIKWFLLFHRLAKQENIEVSREDTENWIKRFADSYRMDFDKAKELLAQSGKATEIRDGILEDNVLKFLLEKAAAK